MILLNYPEFLHDMSFDLSKIAISAKPERTCIVSIGKSAFFMYEKFILARQEYKNCKTMIISPFRSAAQYGSNVETAVSTHPEITEKSFIAFEKLYKFISGSSPEHIIVLISGGSSALMEKSGDPEKVCRLNSELLRSGLPITEINRARISSSMIKGGKLAEMFPEIFWSVLVMSDIPSENGEHLVGSMPFFRKDLPNTELFKIADSDTLHDEILRILGRKEIFSIRMFNGTVDELAGIILQKMRNGTKDILITGEPVLKVDNPDPGTGGRMCHLALKMLSHLESDSIFYALSSDGMDGNSGFAGAVIEHPEMKPDTLEIDAALTNYNSAHLLFKWGMCIKTGYTGLNLNDFVIFSRS